MSDKSPAIPARHLPVLRIGSTYAEWLEIRLDGTQLWGQSPVGGPGAGDLIRAAEEAVADAGAHPGPCVLSLGRGMLEENIVGLPELTRKEVADVLTRRAARLLDCQPSEAAFNALPTHTVEATEESKNAREMWLVTAVRRGPFRALLESLRESGFSVRRTVSSQLATLNLVRGTCVGGAGIAVVVAPTSISVSLIAGDRLVNQEIYEGSFDENTSLAASLVQDVRTRAAYWRKVSRGQGVEWVGVLGLTDSRAEGLKNSIALALPEAAISILPGSDDEEVARRAGVQAAVCPGPFGRDITLSLPPRKRTVMVAAAVSLLLALVPAAIVHRDLSHETDVAIERAESLLARTLELETLEETRERADEAVGVLAAKLARQSALQRCGVPLERLLAELFASIQPSGHLMSAKFEQNHSGVGARILVTGWTFPGAAESARAVRGVIESLESFGTLQNIEVAPPPRIPGTERGAQDEDYLEFLLEGETVEGSDA